MRNKDAIARLRELGVEVTPIPRTGEYKTRYVNGKWCRFAANRKDASQELMRVLAAWEKRKRAYPDGTPGEVAKREARKSA